MVQNRVGLHGTGGRCAEVVGDLLRGNSDLGSGYVGDRAVEAPGTRTTQAGMVVRGEAAAVSDEEEIG